MPFFFGNNMLYLFISRLRGECMNYIKAKKNLGQNFLKDEAVLEKIANSFDLSNDDLIIEIGPGKGALTKYLIQKPSALLCYEIDERMKDILVCFNSENSKIIFDDFLNRDIQKDISRTYKNIFVIANIPYYITTPIIEHLINCNVLISGMTLLVQKEVADRFVASPKSKDYGYFTVYLNHFYQVEKLCDVSPQCFSPAPKVWSSVVRFVPKNDNSQIPLQEFQKFLKQAFSYKRKTLKNNLQDYNWIIILEFLNSKKMSETTRAEELSYDDFIELYKKLTES